MQSYIGPPLQATPLVAFPIQYGYPVQRNMIPQTIVAPHFLRRQTEPIPQWQKKPTWRRNFQHVEMSHSEAQGQQRESIRQLTDLCRGQALRVDRQIECSLSIPSQILMSSRNHFNLRPIPATALTQHSRLFVFVSECSEPTGQDPPNSSRSSAPRAEASRGTSKAEEKRATDKRLRTAFYSRPNEIIGVTPVSWYCNYL